MYCFLVMLCSLGCSAHLQTVLITLPDANLLLADACCMHLCTKRTIHLMPEKGPLRVVFLERSTFVVHSHSCGLLHGLVVAPCIIVYERKRVPVTDRDSLALPSNELLFLLFILLFLLIFFFLPFCFLLALPSSSFFPSLPTLVVTLLVSISIRYIKKQNVCGWPGKTY